MRTPLGFNRATSAAAVRAGISAIGEHPFMIDRFGQPMKVTRDAGLDPDMSGVERLTELALPAVREALLPIENRGAKVTILLNFGEVRPGLDAEMTAAVADRLLDAIKGSIIPARVRHWMGGHAGGIVGMQAGANLIASGEADFVLIGGIDSYLNADTLERLDDIEQLHSENNIYGFCPGEAAGFVLLAKPGRIGTELDLIGAGSEIEENVIKTEDICLGEGLAAAFKAAAISITEGHFVDQIFCDMNGERYRGNEYGFAVLKTSGLFEDAVDFKTPADCWGDVGAASGPLYAGLAIEAESRGYAKGPLTMIWASSEAGHRAAAILERRGGS
ncbi:beta-ketoacyl synthase N-terminal-like domain-containing protein [Tateyamaria pelophila]|uniref:beta-ketoacyl synthase N-terminal-like domain-containing protein n=1 Tax=Tateyamaria pelophila TaxID=328415 RepID=UPI001CBFE2AF|nr:beta-ketoacyl synthase N-terminal-like domain-containing protein [Tateyamaria pelophila]